MSKTYMCKWQRKFTRRGEQWFSYSVVEGTKAPTRRSLRNVCKGGHKQPYVPFKTITTSRGELDLVDVLPCGICAKMPQWIRRVEAAIAAKVYEGRNDIVGSVLKNAAPERTRPWSPKEVVEYLLQENQYRKASVKWSTSEARRWLDGEDIEVLSSMEKVFKADPRQANGWVRHANHGCKALD